MFVLDLENSDRVTKLHSWEPGMFETEDLIVALEFIEILELRLRWYQFELRFIQVDFE